MKTCASASCSSGRAAPPPCWPIRALGFYVQRLPQPLAPGDSLPLTFDLYYDAPGFEQQTARHRHRGQRHVRQQRHPAPHRLQCGCGNKRGKRPQEVRPQAQAAHGPPRRHDRPRQHLHCLRRRLGALRRHREHRARPAGPGPRLPAKGVDRKRPPLLPLRHGRAHPGLLLVPVGPLRRAACQVAAT